MGAQDYDAYQREVGNDNSSSFDLPFTIKEEELKGPELIATGKYPAEIIAATCNKTKSGGDSLLVKYRIVGDVERNRVVSHFINIKNASAEAQAIGERSLKELMKAVGVKEMSKTTALIDKKLSILVDKKLDNRNGGMMNYVKGTFAWLGDVVQANPNDMPFPVKVDKNKLDDDLPF